MHEDTIRLLGDCAAGIDLAVSTMDALLPEIRNRDLRQQLRGSMALHDQLRSQTHSLLQQYGGREHPPSPMTRGLSWLKPNTRMAMRADATTAAYLVAAHCDTGVKSLCRSRNRYAGASADAVALTQKLIQCEENLSAGLRPYL